MNKEIKRKPMGRISVLVVIGIFITMTPISVSAQPNPDNWSKTGDDPDTGEFLGTTTNEDLVIKTYDTTRIIVEADGDLNVDSGTLFVDESADRVGIGTTNPSAKLDVEVSSGGAATIGSSNCAATGDYSVAMGDWTTASGDYSVAMGWDTEAIGDGAVAMGGTETYARGYCSLAVGCIAETGTDASFSFAIGCAVEANGYCSGVMGTWANAEADRSFVIGGGADSLNVLTNNVEESLMVGFDSTTPTLFVDGNSMGIGGTTSPDAKLEILSTSTQLQLTYEDASDYATFAVNRDGRLDINTYDVDGVVGHINLIPDGNVGIGTINPRSKLSVAGGATIGSVWASTYIANSGSLLVENNVGIGVANPAEKLEVDGNVLFNLGQDRQLYVESATSGGHRDGDDLTIKAGNGYFNNQLPGQHGYDGGNLYLRAGDGDGAPGGDGGDVYIYGGLKDTQSVDGDVILAHTGSAVRGNVGIGVTNPNERLEVNGKIRANTCFNVGGTDGISRTVQIQGTNYLHTLIFTGGILTSYNFQ